MFLLENSRRGASMAPHSRSEQAIWKIFLRLRREVPGMWRQLPEEKRPARCGCRVTVAHHRTWRETLPPSRWSANAILTRTFLRYMTYTCRLRLATASRPASGWRFSATGHDKWMPFRWIFQLDPTMWSDRVMDWRLISVAAYQSGWFERWTARDGLHCPKSARCSSVSIRLEKFSRQYSRRFARNFETYQQTSLCPDCAPCGCTSSEKLPNQGPTISVRFPRRSTRCSRPGNHAARLPSRSETLSG